MAVSFDPISEQPFKFQELVNRKLHLAVAKLTIAGDLTEIFALFCKLATIELKLNQTFPNETAPDLLIVYAISTSLLIACTVLVKIAVMYITPRLETALFLARYDINELDQILRKHIETYANVVWIVASLCSTFLFTLNFIILVWVKYKTISMPSVKSGTIILSPVLVVIVVFSVCVHFRTRRRNKRGFLNEEKIDSGSPDVRYSRQFYLKSDAKNV